MAKGIIGESGADRATDKMDKYIQRSTNEIKRMPTLLEQFKQAYPETWKYEILKEIKKYEINKKKI